MNRVRIIQLHSSGEIAQPFHGRHITARPKFSCGNNGHIALPITLRYAFRAETAWG
jgi:hypothetical protein